MIEQCFGDRYVFRAFAEANTVVKYSEPVQAYQRKPSDRHVNEIANYFKSGYNSYTTEIVLAYSIDDWYDEKFNPVFYGGMIHGGGIEPIDFLTGNNALARGFIADTLSPRTHVILRDRWGVSFKKAGSLIKLTIPNGVTQKPFRRIDGNHRLNAFETLDNKTASSIIPISIILLPNDHERDNTLRTEMELFHNINGKSKPLTNIEQYRGFLNLFTAEELQKFGQHFAITKSYIDRYGHDKINFNGYNTGQDDIVLNCVQFLIDREICVTSDELHNAFVYLDYDLLTKHREQLSHFNNRFAIVPFVYYFFKDNIDEKPKFNAYAKWFIKNKLYFSEDFDPASSINNFEHIPRTIFMSMQFGDKTKDTYDAVEQVRDILKRDDGIDLELIKVDEHKQGYSDEIYHRIKTGIEKAELVIADLTYGNHNVHHEIGYAQGLGKKYCCYGANMMV